MGRLHEVMDEALIRSVAGERYYARGLAYVRQARVTSLGGDDREIRATVNGKEKYSVSVGVRQNQLTYRCSCPMGMDGDFCKHCVATALAWLQQNASDKPARRQKGRSPCDRDDLAKALGQETKETLVAWLLAWADEDAALRTRLVRAAARHLDAGVLIAQCKQQIENAIRVRRFVEYRDMRAYAAGVRDALAELEALLASGQAAAVVEIAEHSMQWLTGAIEKVDDSDGYMSVLRDDLREIHLQACIVARPEPVALGERLFLLQLRSEYGEWYGATERYAPVLGLSGLAALRKKAQSAWAKIPALTKVEQRAKIPHFTQLKSIMESLASLSGDLEELVGVLARDLTYDGQYLRIAEAYRDAGEYDQAMEWAQRGADRSGGYRGAALRMFMAKEYQRRGCHADALRIVWLAFRERPSLTSYKDLEGFARAAEEWDDWRTQAWLGMRRVFTEAGGNPHRLDRSLLVEILLYEERGEEAWQEAQAGGCQDQLWLELAKWRAPTSPEEAAAVYLAQAQRSIDHDHKNQYRRGVALLEQAAALFKAQGKQAEFCHLLNGILLNYKLKRNLLKLVGERRAHLCMEP